MSSAFPRAPLCGPLTSAPPAALRFPAQRKMYDIHAGFCPNTPDQVRAGRLAAGRGPLTPCLVGTRTQIAQLQSLLKAQKDKELRQMGQQAQKVLQMEKEVDGVLAHTAQRTVHP